jgi:hypothetical protein
MRTVAAFVFLSLLSFCLQANDLLLGYGTHFAQGKTNIRLFEDNQAWSGLNSHRDEVYWGHSELERSRFEPNSVTQQSLKVFKDQSRKGMSPLVVLSYGNRLYDGGGQPITPPGVAGFARYAEWVARELSPSGVFHYEVWNEWNLGAGTRPKVRYGSPAEYVMLLKHTRAALKRVSPNNLVIGGAVGDDLPNWTWLRKAIDVGLLKYVDVISVHLYNHSVSEDRAGVPDLIAGLWSLRKILADSGRPDLKIYVTEVGWPNHYPFGVDFSSSASQAFVFALEASQISGVKGIWFYEMFDGGLNLFEREQNFGAYRHNGKRKPMACSVRLVSKFLLRAQLERVETKGDSVLRVYSDHEYHYYAIYGMRSHGVVKYRMHAKSDALAIDHLDWERCDFKLASELRAVGTSSGVPLIYRVKSSRKSEAIFSLD